jgi:hypothetical protein
MNYERILVNHIDHQGCALLSCSHEWYDQVFSLQNGFWKHFSSMHKSHAWHIQMRSQVPFYSTGGTMLLSLFHSPVYFITWSKSGKWVILPKGRTHKDKDEKRQPNLSSARLSAPQISYALNGSRIRICFEEDLCASPNPCNLSSQYTREKCTCSCYCTPAASLWGTSVFRVYMRTESHLLI